MADKGSGSDFFPDPDPGAQKDQIRIRIRDTGFVSLRVDIERLTSFQVSYVKINQKSNFQLPTLN